MKKFATGFITGLLVATTSIGIFATATSYTLTKSETPIYVNSVKYPTDALPILNLDLDGNGNTYVPLRNLSEMLGANVDWNNDTKAIGITTTGNVVAQNIDTKTTTQTVNSELQVYTFDGVEYYYYLDIVKSLNLYTENIEFDNNGLATKMNILNKDTKEIVYSNIPVYTDINLDKYIKISDYNNLIK